ncbi:MAG: hypothetical protein QXZ10_02920 [Sulfolobales archaeon]
MSRNNARTINRTPYPLPILNRALLVSFEVRMPIRARMIIVSIIINITRVVSLNL